MKKLILLSFIFFISCKDSLDYYVEDKPAPFITKSSNQAIGSMLPFNIDINDQYTGNDSDRNAIPLNYECFFDTVVDQSVSESQLCTAAGMSFNKIMGLLDWTPNHADVGFYEIKIIASNGEQEDYDIFSLEVTLTTLTITSIARKIPSSLTTVATDVDFDVRFNIPVSNLALTDFQLTMTDTVTGNLNSLSGSGTTYTVNANTLAGNGMLSLELNDSDWSITDLSGGSLAQNTYYYGQFYILGANPFAGGDGSASSPFQIVTAAQLDEVSNYSTAYFILNNNIDMNAQPYTPAPTFYGNFDGQDFAIENWTDTGAKVGFFGDVAGNAVIQNLWLRNVALDSTGTSNVGALAGTVSSASVNIQNVYVTGTVTADNNVGGLIGSSTANATYNHIHFKGTVDAIADAGGIIGEATDGSLSKTSAYGKITGTGNNVGGVVGHMSSTTGTFSISEAYTFAKVTGINNAGGLVGLLSNGTLQYSINRGDIVATTYPGGLAGEISAIATNIIFNEVINTGYPSGTNAGAIVGNNGGINTETNIFFDISTSELSNAQGAAAAVTTTSYYMPDMKTNSNFAVLSTTYWDLVNDQYPTLKWRRGEGSCSAVASPFGAGVGTAYSPYQICDLAQLENMASSTAYELNSFILRSDIDMTATTYLMVDDFQGVFLGNYYELSNWTFNNTGSPGGVRVGIFRSHTDSVIEDVYLDNFNITGKEFIGTLSGIGQGTEISIASNIKVTNATLLAVGGTDRVYSGGVIASINGLAMDLFFSGNITSTSTNFNYLGAIAMAQGANSETRRASTEGIMNCSSVCGGIIAQMDGKLSQVKSTMTIISGAGNRTGGITASFSYNSVIRDAYYDGSLDALTWVGGIAGTKGSGAGTPTATRGWSKVNITGAGSFDGIIFGRNEGAVTWSEFYGDTQASSTADLDGDTPEAGYTGANTATMQTAATFAAWPTEIWDIQNGDYPRFTWE